MTTPEKKAALCPNCRKKAAANLPYERRVCDGAEGAPACGRSGCRHLVIGDGKRDVCGPCRLSGHRRARVPKPAVTP